MSKKDSRAEALARTAELLRKAAGILDSLASPDSLEKGESAKRRICD